QHTSAALAGCYVISLRPVGAHGGIRRAAAAHGARVLALSPWSLQRRDDDATRARLRDALQADIVIATSPAAVHAAAELSALSLSNRPAWIAAGAGTAAALRRAGIKTVTAPAHMDSDGVLALPQLHNVRGVAIGLLSAPGGRDLLMPTLTARGAQVLRADVYARVPAMPSSRCLATLRMLDAPVWLALSSAGALKRILACLPADAIAALHRTRVVAASARLATIAREAGFGPAIIATDARPASLIRAAAAAAGAVVPPHMRMR
ncbi:MAG: uroporphyrinogen-III synthase, partial [Luteimonas sp.]